jgi:murein hydrolase activator
VKLSLFGFVLRRVGSNLRLLLWTHVLTAGTMAMTLFVFGGFMLLEINLQRLLKGWGDQIQITAYLNKGLAREEVEALVKNIAAMAEVERVRHISQEQAWRDFQTALGAQSGLLEGLPREVLPASLEISLKPAYRDGLVVEELAERIRKTPQFARVEFPQEWVERLALAVLAVEWIKWIFGGVLFLATFFIVGSTVKLAILARQDEVEIMQLVGASEQLIQAPFVIEGMIQGLAGGALALAGLWSGYLLLRGEVPALGGFLAPLGEPQFLDLHSMALLIIIGWLLGAAGSLISLRRFIKTWKASRVLIALLGCLLLPALSHAAADKGALEGIRNKIESEKKDLSRLKDKETSVLQSLGKIQTELAARTKELKRAAAKLSSVGGELRAKSDEAERLAASIAARQALLAKRAAALYRWQRGGSPLVILNGSATLAAFMQREHYLEAALSFDRDLLTQLGAEKQRQTALRAELLEKKAELAEQQKSLDAAQHAISEEAAKKKVLLGGLRREKETRLRALKEMEAAAQRLEKMLEEIARRALGKPKATPSLPSPGSGLEALRGRLEWPVHGRITAPFGKYRHPVFAAEIVRKGIDIDAPLGEEIKAVEKGRVVYADRFSGYGNMVIVDHGERYYTIYGHLSEMLKKTGDEVRRGEVLGRAGDSDSLAGSKLYFEIRKDGHSLDPVPWFKKQ